MNEEKHTAGESFRFQVNLGGMLDILSNHLYKSPDVFLRELLQNGADAITLRQKRLDRGEDHHQPGAGEKDGVPGQRRRT